ncbi:MAG: thiosulfohydrolase SoxB [Gammaproteobacteria bacterium]|nr:thiosulfohydrolase SoxB [Gammaproteobacteria bacterium]
MSLSRREFLQMLAVASTAGLALPGCSNEGWVKGGRPSTDLYDVPVFGNVSLLHFTDTHAQVLPVYFREPNENIGVGSHTNKPPHLVGEHFLKFYGIDAGTHRAYASTYLDFTEAARRYGKVGGFAHLATLIRRMRDARTGRNLLLDGGDTWQGSATALWTRGQDMIDAQKLLGIDIMTGHWEFTYGADRVKYVVDHDFKQSHIEFLAQNVFDDTWGDPIFKPYVIRELNGVPVAVIGQAFPYTPIAHPRYLTPDWTFGIHDHHMQKMVDKARAEGAQVVVVLSHNGMDVDLKMATRVRGVDVILGGHTHDVVPAPVIVPNAGGRTLVINSGTNTKFLSVLDLEVKGGKMTDYRYHLLPIFADLIEPDAAMTAHIERSRAPFKEKLAEKLAVTDSLLYRRGNFNGTFDQVIVDAMREVQDAPIALSPGFRWGTSLLPGDTIDMEHLMDQSAITYPNTDVNEMTGAELKQYLEAVADNLFNRDPYLQMGGDMVRTGGIRYAMNPTRTMGHRISDLEVNGVPVRANKRYKVAGWASVAKPLTTRPIWEVVAEYLRDKKTVTIDRPDTPVLKGIAGNKGYVAL